MIEENLIILVGSPRSGSTLLQRMLGSHSQIYTHPEPHLLTPLYYLGYYATVDKAPYDHINAAQALRELTEELPRGETDYLDAVRQYANTIYERVLAPTGKTYFLDKTPAYGLVLPFIAKLYPRAKYVVLTRHPFAIANSVAHSFFGGDYRAAREASPIVQRYVPAVGQFMIDKPVPFVHVRYEDLVVHPEIEMRRLLQHLGLPYEANVIEYGHSAHIKKSYGDPITVNKHTKPMTESVDAWQTELVSNRDARHFADIDLNMLDPAHLHAWGYPRADIQATLDRLPSVSNRQGNRNPISKWFNVYRLKRAVILRLRRNIHQNALGRVLRKIRYACDVLLRES